tara:strand:- start:360 stop:770 length:411 start_codon:yes stop_codon:yes gene_type:complete
MIALPNGDLCVADRLYSRLQVLSRDGEQKHTIGNYGRSTGQMVSCKGMACDGEFLYVSDYAKSRVQKLRLHDGALVASVGNYGTAAWPKCSLGSAPARLLRLSKARLALPGRSCATGRPTTAFKARRLQSRRRHRL